MTGIKFVSFFCYYGGINVHVVNSRFTYNNGSDVLLNSNLDMLYADIKLYTTRKSINTNGNTEGITVGKKIKQSKKNDDVSFLSTELPTKFILLVKPVGEFVGKL